MWSTTGAGLAGGVSTPGFQLPTTGSISTILGFATGVGLPSSQSTPSFTLASTGSLSTILGFATGTYPSSTTVSQSLSSTLTPVGSTVNALVLRCNLVSNIVAVPSEVLDLVPIYSTFGSNVTYNPQFPKWIKLRDGIYNTAIFLSLIHI